MLDELMDIYRQYITQKQTRKTRELKKDLCRVHLEELREPDRETNGQGKLCYRTMMAQNHQTIGLQGTLHLTSQPAYFKGYTSRNFSSNTSSNSSLWEEDK